MQDQLVAVLSRAKRLAGSEALAGATSSEDVLRAFSELDSTTRPRSKSDVGAQKKTFTLPRISSSSLVHSDISAWLELLLSFVCVLLGAF